MYTKYFTLPKEITKNYVDWFNNRRISQKTKGMAPYEYREHALAV
ncbi:integrase core domain-containing protein [Limosilactobacillus fermentum]|nr:IS3 family transposase [Limosilactobacillus fermentum]MCC6111434.1 integrase core domain-containing protein [Limosilactobacillus fermentum]TFZ20067.1 hypothetical protein E2P74_00575 [Limosilactobacillus fermentum]